MKKEQLWAAYVAKNPQFKGTQRFSMTPQGLRKLFEQTWDRGYEEGIENGKAIGRAQAAPKATTDMPEFMRGIFK